MLRPFAIAGIRTTAYMKLLMLLLAYFEAFLAPKPVNPLEVDEPALLPELYCNPAIAVSRMLGDVRQANHQSQAYLSQAV
jgi:hypothetical protein